MGKNTMMNKKSSLTILAVMVITGSLFMSKPAYAANGFFGGSNFFTGLVEFISQKFGLDKTKVQSVLQDYQKQKMATIIPRPTMTPQQQEDAEKKRFDVLVTQGKITNAQETAIIAELAALRAKYPFDQNTTPDKRKTQMQDIQKELQAWAHAQNIPLGYIMRVRGGFGEEIGNGGVRKGRDFQTGLHP